MPSVLRNPTIPRRVISYRQAQYLSTRKTDRKRVEKRERNIQLELRNWFVDKFPGVHFVSDTASGAFSSQWEKQQHTELQSHKDEPDIEIRYPRKGFCALLIELKADCTHTPKHKDCMIRMRSNGRKIKVYKDKKGRIIERDYKIRMKGDYINLHTERQAATLDYYNSIGYCARFGLGLEHAKQIICAYFDVPYEENSELF